MSNKHLTELSTLKFRNFLKLGCILRFLPYQWNEATNNLIAPDSFNRAIFNVQKNLHLYYTAFMWIRFIHGLCLRQFSLVGALWCTAFSSAFTSYIVMFLYADELMYFSNRLLNNILLGKKEIGNKNMAKIENGNRKYLNYHLAFNTFLVYANPVLHIFTVTENPCAPNFISSLIFQCDNSKDNNVSLTAKILFLAFEGYNVVKWQYVVSFMWCCLYMGIDIVHEELRKLKQLRLKMGTKYLNSDAIYRQLKKCELIVHFLNHTLHYYMGMFVMIGVTVVSLLLYGTIKYWRLGFTAIIMFPLCAIRYGFEVLTPLSIAGTMSKESKLVLQNWKNGLSTGSFIKTRREMIRWKYLQKSCKLLKSRSGIFSRFDKLVLLATVDICITVTVNLLVFDNS